SLAYTPVRKGRPRRAKRNDLLGLGVLERPLEMHFAARPQLSGDVDQGPPRAGPYMPPLSSTWNEKAETGSGRSADARPLLEDRAAAVLLRDRVEADQRAVDRPVLPPPEPEVELRRFRRGRAGVYARTNAAQHALEAR